LITYYYVLTHANIEVQQLRSSGECLRRVELSITSSDATVGPAKADHIVEIENTQNLYLVGIPLGDSGIGVSFATQGHPLRRRIF
jgi:hypothetical protein